MRRQKVVGFKSLSEPALTCGIRIARTIGEALAEPQSVRRYYNISPPKSLKGSPEGPGLIGNAGVAILHRMLELVDGGTRWAFAQHEHLSYAAGFNRAKVELFTGLAGLLAAGEYAGRGTGRYQRLREAVSTALLETINVRAADLSAEFEPVPAFDIISGVSGLVLATEDRDSHRGAARYFRSLLSTDTKWSSAPLISERSGMRANNMGFAHGIAGMLSALCEIDDASCHAVAVEVCEWILARSIPTPFGIQWPSSVVGSRRLNSRSAWCYGTPGVALALWKAGVTLNERRYREASLASLRAMVRRPQVDWGMVDHCICHGTAGNALILCAIGRSAGAQDLLLTGSTLLEKVIREYDEGIPLGYRFYVGENREPFYSASALNGAAGVALAILATATDVDCSWFRYWGLF